MFLIVITSEDTLPNEAEHLNKMFEAGMEVLHLRKQKFTLIDYKKLLNDINAEYYKRIMIHDHHELVSEYGLKGAHLREKYRLSFGPKLKRFISGFKAHDYNVSSAFHDPNDIKNCSTEFNYTFLSPVFDSISKIGHEGKGFDVSDVKSDVIALGGINKGNVKATKKMGGKVS